MTITGYSQKTDNEIKPFLGILELEGTVADMFDVVGKRTTEESEVLRPLGIIHQL